MFMFVRLGAFVFVSQFAVVIPIESQVAQMATPHQKRLKFNYYAINNETQGKYTRTATEFSYKSKTIFMLTGFAEKQNGTTSMLKMDHSTSMYRTLSAIYYPYLHLITQEKPHNPVINTYLHIMLRTCLHFFGMQLQPFLCRQNGNYNEKFFVFCLWLQSVYSLHCFRCESDFKQVGWVSILTELLCTHRILTLCRTPPCVELLWIVYDQEFVGCFNKMKNCIKCLKYLSRQTDIRALGSAALRFQRHIKKPLKMGSDFGRLSVKKS